MLTMLDDGLWEADARLELEELDASRRCPPDRRGRRDRHHRRAGLPACRAHPAARRIVVHPSGWRLESIDSDGRRDPPRPAPRPRARVRADLRLRHLCRRPPAAAAGARTARRCHRFAFQPATGGRCCRSPSPACASCIAARRRCAARWRSAGVRLRPVPHRAQLDRDRLHLSSPACRPGSAGSRWCWSRSTSRSIRRWRPASRGGWAGAAGAAAARFAGAWALTEWLRGERCSPASPGTRPA